MSANQSHQEIELGPNPVSSTKPKIDNTLSYRGRRLDKDSLRLIEIQPATQESDPIVGTLTEVTFSSRPKFEALSYTWGTEKANDAIILNGFPFEVGKNLLDALLFLRRQVMSKKACQLYWIDAICINQSDVMERNRQLMIMDQIYFRAGTVVVWLGSKYAEFQKDMKPDEREKPEEVPPKGSNSMQQKMVRHLRIDPYWDRLWILQEIGRARKLQVCLGIESFSWEDFMSLITMHNSDRTTGPLKLDKLLRQEKYVGSCTLKRLIEDHREAKCSEPRDKIYGLVKLALDAEEFPIDYSKSLYEVWKDTMEFMNKWNLFKEGSQILPFGALVKSLLMANHSDPLSRLLNEHEDQVDSTQLIDNPESHAGFSLQAVPLGCIVGAGSSSNGAASRSDEAVIWDEQNCYKLKGLPENMSEYIKGARRVTGRNALWWETPRQVTDRLAPAQTRLYLDKRFYGHTLRNVGVSPALIQPRDAVFQVPSSKRVLLARVVEEDPQKAKMRVFGTVLATEDICGSTTDSDYTQRWRSLEDGWTTEVQVDAGTIFMLLE